MKRRGARRLIPAALLLVLGTVLADLAWGIIRGPRKDEHQAALRQEMVRLYREIGGDLGRMDEGQWKRYRALRASRLPQPGPLTAEEKKEYLEHRMQAIRYRSGGNPQALTAAEREFLRKHSGGRYRPGGGSPPDSRTSRD